jgi:hypothetical protein
MSLAQEKINSLKKLTALSTGERLNIDGVLDSFASLQTLSTESASGVSRSGINVLFPREDRVLVSEASPEELLACSHQKVVARQIALGSIMHGE